MMIIKGCDVSSYRGNADVGYSEDNFAIDNRQTYELRIGKRKNCVPILTNTEK
jgi:hypothetical protein